MTPQEKAQELVDRFYQTQCDVLLKSGTAPLDEVEYQISKQCALIAVEEIIKALHEADTAYDLVPKIEYWNEVKTEQEAQKRFDKRVSQLLALDMYGPTKVAVDKDGVEIMGFICKPSVYEPHIDSVSISGDGIREMSDEAWSLIIADVNRRLDQIRKLEKEKE